MPEKIQLKPNETILFIGDSITDADRNRQCYKPFGFGYVHFVAYYLLAKYPEYNLKIINRGISGNNIRNLKDRWKRDCIDHKPDLLSVLIGVNDVWRQFSGESDLPRAVFDDEYEATYRQLLNAVTKQCNSRLVIIEPFMFCDDYNNLMFNELRRFIELVHNIAADFDCVLVPMQSLIDERIKKIAPQNWSLDMVHPQLWAHSWLAQQWITTTGF